MSNIKTDGGLSYTIPVDSLDLKYLSKYVSSTEILPLWTKTRLNGEDGYCQVQILAQNEEECYSEPSDTYECHICNVHVPVTCSKDHNESVQHRTFKNIYQKILEKLSKQMDTSIVKHDEKIDKDAYYCVPCSKIIKKENRDKHESSEFHAKSNKDTIIISEFYKIINEDGSQTNDIIVIEERLTQDSDLEPVNSKSCIENNNYAITINKLNNNYLENGLDDLPTYANKLATPGPSTNDNKMQPPNTKMIQDTRVQKVGKTYCEDCNLYIETHNFSVHIISKKHLNGIMIKHSIIKTENPNIFFCKLCNLTVSKNDIKNHVVARTHLIKQTNDATKLNMNGATDLGNNDGASKINNKNTKTAIVNDKNTDSSAADIKTNNLEYCKICKVKIPIGGMQIHVVGKAHKQKLNEYYKFLCYTDDAKTKVKCEICHVNIPKLDRNIIEHMEGRNHAITVTELLKFHLITKQSSRYLCECCDVQTTDYLEHINSRSHTITFSQKYEMDKTEMRKYVYESDVNDVVARRYRAQYWNLLKHNGISKLNDTSYYCGKCKIKLGRISELDHVLGERHALNSLVFVQD